jgi:hypothetical protein
MTRITRRQFAATTAGAVAGDIPAAMLRMPGTPASAAYTDESYAMARKGELDLNLGVNLVFLRDRRACRRRRSHYLRTRAGGIRYSLFVF